METITPSVRLAIRLSIMLFFLAGVTFSQNPLSGIYSSLGPNQEHYNFYKLNSDSTFEYHKGGSLGDSQYGYGEYYIKDDTLIVKYNTTNLKKDSFIKTEKWLTKKDSIHISFVIEDFAENRIPGVNVYSLEDKNGTTSDYNGNAMLTYNKYQKNIDIYVSYLGFIPLEFSLSSEFCYKISVYLAKNEPKGLPIYNCEERFFLKNKEHLISKNGDWVKISN